MTIGASTRERWLGALISGAAVLYLTPFVVRGWIPHDEGMLGQAAERVMRGGIPHIDYEEPYTGGLSWLYAWLFRFGGVDLRNVRWLLFVGAIAAIWLLYAIARRYLPPAGAALAAWVALVWSFPNYFAGLPSWWLLICALAALWSFVRFVETRRARYLVGAGLAAGLAIVIKQTGVYLYVALILSVCWDEGLRRRDGSWWTSAERVVRWGAAVLAALAAAAILAPRVLGADGVYLLVPVVACSLALCTARQQHGEPACNVSLIAAISVATAAAALPVVCLLIPYVARHRIWDFIDGALLLPRKRLTFASMSMPPAVFIVAGVPLLALVFARRARLLGWTTAIVLAIAAVWSVVGYQIVWQSTRAFAALLPVAVACAFAAGGRGSDSGDTLDPRRRTLLFASVAVLAWMSLNQFPFAAPVYFSYTTPLAVIAGIAAADTMSCLRARNMLPWSALLLSFGVLVTNRGDVHALGLMNVASRFDTPLNLPRAHLRVGQGEANVYRRLVSSIRAHLHGGQLTAGPDCPEVYFLIGSRSASGSLFDFFTGSESDEQARWLNAQVVVVNHGPQFSPALSEGFLTVVRREFDHAERIGQFEVRWR